MHALLIEEHRGLSGAHNEQGLESSLARAENLHAHSEKGVSLEELAAAYGYGLARNHCFTDGNKRIGCFIFLLYLKIQNIPSKLNDNGLVALALLMAESQPEQKNLMIRLIVNLLIN